MSARDPVPSFDINRVATVRQTGVGAIDKIDDICLHYKGKGLTKFLCVTSAGAYKTCGAWDKCLAAFQKHGIEHALYDGCRANPETTQVEAAVVIGTGFGAQVVLGIGGGSPIDAAKCIALRLGDPDVPVGEYIAKPLSQPIKACLPIVTINTTHGTGTEVDRFSVISNPPLQKPVLGYNAIYPEFSIDDPALMVTLPREQTLWTTLDALNHVNEAATTVIASPFSIHLARIVCDLIAKFLPIALEDAANLEARYYLLYASMIAGIAFDNSLLHLTHSMEHTLSAKNPSLAHGLGLCMILPAVNLEIYESSGPVLADIYRNILPGFTGAPEEGVRFAKALEDWMKGLGIDTKLSDHGFTEEDIPGLVKAVRDCEALNTLNSIAPNWGEAGQQNEVLEKIYRSSMTWME